MIKKNIYLCLSAMFAILAFFSILGLKLEIYGYIFIYSEFIFGILYLVEEFGK